MVNSNSEFNIVDDGFVRKRGVTLYLSENTVKFLDGLVKETGFNRSQIVELALRKGEAFSHDIKDIQSLVKSLGLKVRKKHHRKKF